MSGETADLERRVKQAENDIARLSSPGLGCFVVVFAILWMLFLGKSACRDIKMLMQQFIIETITEHEAKKEKE